MNYMAKLHFFYSTMNAGKSTSLLQSNHNYIESNLKTLLFLPKQIAETSNNKIISRIGLEEEAVVFDNNFNLFEHIKNNGSDYLDCIFVDEAQFLDRYQVRQLSMVVDTFNIPVMCYGIRTDFQGELFEGSKELLAISDNLIELKTVCFQCNKKATMVIRLDHNGKVATKGKKVLIGGNEIYKSICRKHFRELTKLL